MPAQVNLGQNLVQQLGFRLNVEKVVPVLDDLSQANVVAFSRDCPLKILTLKINDLR